LPTVHNSEVCRYNTGSVAYARYNRKKAALLAFYETTAGVCCLLKKTGDNLRKRQHVTPQKLPTDLGLSLLCPLL